jgi:hypothetical protein
VAGASTPLSVAAGSHTITFQRLDTAGGANTVFVDEIQIVSA